MRPGSQAGMTLVEVMVALFLLAVGLLAVAPMFVVATRGNATGADLGSVNALGLERMELLRAQPYSTLTAGGSLTSSQAGYSDGSTSGYVVRWQIADNATPSNTKTITVRALAQGVAEGPRREVTLMTLRGNDG